MIKAKKSLTVTLQGNKLETVFEGKWSGNDLRIIMTHLPKRYRMHIRDIRRSDIKSKEREEAQADYTQTVPQNIWSHPTAKQEVNNG